MAGRRHAARTVDIWPGFVDALATLILVIVFVLMIFTLFEFYLKDVISGRIAKDVFEIMLETGEAPGIIVEKRGLTQVTDTAAIEKVVDEVIAANPKQVEQVKAKPTTLGWFVGQVMRATGGKANPAAVNEILKKKLELAD